MLKIIINSDSNLDIDAPAVSAIESDIEGRLGRFEKQLTRVVVHLRDENAHKTAGENDKRCMLEARPEGMHSINVSHSAPTVGEAVNHAVRKLERLLDDTFSRLHDPKGRSPIGRPE
jgi:ribosome-associated translation inhibitor RaiA